MPNQPSTPGHSVRIPDDLWLSIKSAAVEQGTTASDLVRQAIDEWLERRGR